MDVSISPNLPPLISPTPPTPTGELFFYRACLEISSIDGAACCWAIKYADLFWRTRGNGGQGETKQGAKERSNELIMTALARGNATTAWWAFLLKSRAKNIAPLARVENPLSQHLAAASFATQAILTKTPRLAAHRAPDAKTTFRGLTAMTPHHCTRSLCSRGSGV